MTIAAAAVPAPRLNPFAFPSDTGVRFTLLLVTLFSASIFVYRWLLLIGGPADPYASCLASAFAAGQIGLNGRALDCPFVYWGSAAAAVAASAALGGLSFALYLLMPAWRRWRAGFTPLSREDAPEIIAAVTTMAARAGLAQPPLLVWNPLSPSTSAIAFGARGRYVIGLHGGLVTLWSTDRSGFMAVIWHELAHIRNGDIDRTYLTVASWWAFLLAAVLPFAVSLTRDLRSVLDVGVRAAVLAFLVYLIRNAVLRSRESYADVRASVWDGPAGALHRVIARPPTSRSGLREMVAGRHPRPGWRLRVLADTGLLFPVRSSDAFLTGVVGSVAVTNLTNTAAALTIRGQLHYDVAFLAVGLAELLGSGLLLGAFAIGVIGSGIWRISFALLAGRAARAGVLRLATAMGLGILAGHLLGFQVPAEAGGVSGARLAAVGLWLALCTIVLIGGTYVILRWTTAGALAWLGRLGSERSLRRATWGGVALASVLAAGWFGVVVPLRDAIEVLLLRLPSETMATMAADALVIAGGLLLGALGTPPGVLVLVTMLAWPLAAQLRRPSPVAVDWRWGFLGLEAREAAVPPPGELRVAGIVRVALAVAAVYIVLLGALALALAAHRLRVPPGSRQQVAIGGYIGLVAAASLLQALGAAMAVAARGAFAGLRGQLVAFVAGWPMAVALVAVVSWLAGFDLVLTVLTACLVVNCGALMTLLAGLPAGALAARLR